MERSFLDGKVRLLSGDCIEIVRGMPDRSIDSVVTDPPYHLTSTVKRFGSQSAVAAQHGTDGLYARASRDFMGKAWDGGDIAFRAETWVEVLRVLKPGGHLVAFSAPKCQHRMVAAIEDAGFEIRDGLMWMFGSGFPKSHNQHGDWAGWGTALKPAYEPICLARKPLEGTVRVNMAAHGTGAIHIDACRVVAQRGDYDHPGDLTKRPMAANTYAAAGRRDLKVTQAPPNAAGRWPANVVHDGSEEVIVEFPDTNSTPPGNIKPSASTVGVYGEFSRRSLVGHTDSGSVARFFYSAKADADDRLGSKHPTVKPVDLMQWLVRLVTPPGGLVLDPFAGTGTTGEAAFREGFRAVLIEREPEYQIDIARRMGLALGGPDERRHASLKARGKVEHAGPLFGEAAE